MYEVIAVPKEQLNINLDVRNCFKDSYSDFSQKSIKEYIQKLNQFLADSFKSGYSVYQLLEARSYLIDELLKSLYKYFDLQDEKKLALIAVGGYGRSELFLCSDIDILFLYDDFNIPTDLKDKIGNLISFLWDVKLELGCSVRTIEQCIVDSNLDSTIITNLLENRFICGDKIAYQRLYQFLFKETSWSSKRFLKTKIDEQINRHHRYKDTSYTIEPDIKNNPGTLRDLQILLWIANFHFSIGNFEQMLEHKLISSFEYEEILECRDFLFKLRYALHVIVQKHDDRLTLDVQKAVAALLGFGDDGNKPVERMMRSFYRITGRVREINSMLLQILTIIIAGTNIKEQSTFINSNFVKKGHLIDVVDPQIFKNEPQKMVEIFKVIAQTDGVYGLHVNCLKLFREQRRNLKYFLIENPDCRPIFKSIFSSIAIANKALPLMHDHRLLSAYMPTWAYIEGQTQFDMFHDFSVDEHTIRTINVIYDKTVYQNSNDDILYKNIFRQISDTQVLILAAFLHDIGKGRGGHHAQKGAQIAKEFCQMHGFNQLQIKNICWLIENHLLMSAVAQRRDISDPQVIHEFAQKVSDEDKLNMLYCLSVADICGTNQKEWTSWKAMMFKQLYFLTRQYLRQGPENFPDLSLNVLENQNEALILLKKINSTRLRHFWADFKDSYFIHYSPQEIAWHAKNILNYQNQQNSPLILFAQHEDFATSVFIYKRLPLKFVSIACCMAKRKLNVISAQIDNLKNGYGLCTIKIQNQKLQPISSENLHYLRTSLIDSFNQKLEVNYKAIAKNQLFKVRTQINFLKNNAFKYTHLEISTLDRPSLLAKICLVLYNCQCLIRSAKITTTGERADDFFVITSSSGKALSDEQQKQVEESLYKALDE